MALQMTQDALASAIRSAMNEQFEAIIAEEIKEAQARLDRRIREHLAKTAMTVSSFYEMSRDRQDIIIRVMDDRKPTR